jgi:branched-chain amino acid transport system permease protein
MGFLTDPFFYEVLVSGLLAGVMYALVALGFVLIFKASGIFNFAQGVMALFAALTLVGFQTGQVPFAHLINAIFGTEVQFWSDSGLPDILAIVLSLVVMIGLAWVIVRVVLRPLVNQEGIILFMATIGLAFVLEGMGDLMWGANVKKLDVGLPSGPSDIVIDATGMFVEKLEISAALVAVILVVALTLFSQYTKMGRALRAVADDHQAALSVGISLETIWWIVWSVAGIVALVAGVMGRQVGGAVLAQPDRAEGAAGADAGRLHLDPGRDHRRADDRRRREAVRFLHRHRLPRRRDGELVRLHAGPGLPAVPAAGPVRRKDHREGVIKCSTVKPANSRPATRPIWRPFRSGSICGGSGPSWRWRCWWCRS